MAEPQTILLSADRDARKLTGDDLAGRNVFSVPLQLHPCCITASDRVVVVGGYVSDYESQICVLTRQGEEIKTLRTSACPLSILFDRTFTKIACGFGNGNVAIFAEYNGEWTEMKQWNAVDTTILSLLWLNDEVICTGSYFGSISAWNCETGAQIKVIQDKGPRAWCLAASSNNANIVISGHSDGSVCKFNVSTNISVQFQAHDGPLRALQISADNTAIITCSSDKDVAAFGIVSFDLLWRYRCVHQPRSLAVIGNDVIVAVRKSYAIVLDVASGAKTSQFTNKMKRGVRIALSVPAGSLEQIPTEEQPGISPQESSSSPLFHRSSSCQSVDMSFEQTMARFDLVAFADLDEAERQLTSQFVASSPQGDPPAYFA